jgi:hypothetical protein
MEEATCWERGVRSTYKDLLFATLNAAFVHLFC